MIALMLKATLVLLTAGIAAMLLRRRSAALRHLIWAVALATTAGLALATPLLPELAVATPEWPIPRAAEPAEITGTPGAAVGKALGSDIPATGHATTAQLPVRPAAWLLRVWLPGALAVLAWCVLGRLGLARLLRHSAPLESPEWLEALEERRVTAGLARAPQLFVSDRIGSPATWGIRRPVIVLPPAAREWSADRRSAVLSHVIRGDGLSNVIGWIACALYWPNPLVWMAASRLRAEAERAADDHVLAQGVPALEYATHLLDVARGSRIMRLLGASAIGMARPSSLEGRLLAVLDETRNRLIPQPVIRRATWAGSAVLMLPLAALAPSVETGARGAPVASPEQAFVASDSTFEKSYPARPGERLTLSLKTGGSVRIEGWNEQTIRIRGSLGGPDWHRTVIEIVHKAPGLEIHANQDGDRNVSSTSHRFEIMVPRRYDVHLESSGGSLTIIGVEGSFTGNTGGGGLTFERARGQARLETGGGDIDVSDSNLDGSVSTGGGTVRLNRVTGGLRGSSGSGPVVRADRGKDESGALSGVVVGGGGGRVGVSKDRGPRGTLHVEKAGGRIDLERAPNGADVRTGGGEIRIGPGADLVRASTGGGDITIGPVDGSIEAFSGAGTLRATLENADGSLEYSTGKGNAIVTLPRDFNGRFELETAYTQNYGPTRITSDWDLEHSETHEWDSRQGTPRKYVRAGGRAGNGSGLIRIRIVNGDITIRRAR